MSAEVKAFAAVGLSAATTYHFRVRAYNVVGNSAYSNAASATTPAVPVISETFDAGADNFTVVDGPWAVVGGAYRETADNNAATTHLNSRTVHKTAVAGDFTLTVDAQALAAPDPWSNFSVIFGYQDPQNYYFFSSNQSNDAATSGIFKVVGGVSTELADVAGLITPGVTYQLRVVRAGNTIQAYRGGALVATATDGTFASGKVGLGSRQFQASFDNLVVQGSAANPNPDPATPPAAPSSLSATAASTNRIDLTWADNSSDESGFKVERSSDGGATWAQAGTAGANATSFQMTGLSASTAYQFRVRAYNAAGDSGYSNTASATTPLMSEPFNAGAQNFAVVDGVWSAAGGTFAVTADNGATTTHLNSRAVHNTAVAGNFTLTADAKALAAGAPWSNFSVIFGYQDAQNYYFFSSNQSNDAATSGIFRVVNGVSTELADVPSAITPGVTYQVRLVRFGTQIQAYRNGGLVALATDGTFMSGQVGLGSRQFQASFDNLVVQGSAVTPPTTAPAAPSGLTANAASHAQVNLSWADNSSDEAGFKVERSGDGGSTWAQVATTAANATSYQATGLSASTAYQFRVRAFNAAGDSAYSNTASATTPALPAPPAAPSGLAASAASSSQVKLTWADNSNNESGFKIERSGNGGTTWAQVGTAGANATSFQATGLSGSTTYQFRVRATNAGGDSPYSNTASATTPAAPAIAGGWELTAPTAPAGPGRTGPSNPAALAGLPKVSGNLVISTPGTYGGWDRTGNVTIASDGVVLENFILRNGKVDFANRRNVTVRNFQVFNGANATMSGLGADARTCVVEYGAFYAPGDSPMAYHFSARYLYLENVEGDCFAPHGSSGGTIEYCYVNLVGIPANPERHADGWHSFGCTNMTIRYNKFVAGTHAGVNSAVNLDISNSGHRIEYNYFDGGGYTFGMTGGADIVVRGNRWGRNGFAGPVYPTAAGGGVTWTDNAFLDNGQVINKP